MCACVSTTQSIDAGSTGGLFQLRCSSSFDPWNSPQSTSNRLPSASTRYFDPVTVPAAPRKVILAMGPVFYANASKTSSQDFSPSSRFRQSSVPHLDPNPYLPYALSLVRAYE